MLRFCDSYPFWTLNKLTLYVVRLAMSQAYALGSIDEMTWLLAHANHHGWQVNRLTEAAMWGSLLDNGSMKGKLDRIEA